MINAKNIDLSTYSMTTRLLLQEMLARNWDVQLYIEGYSYMRAGRPDGKMLELFGSVPSDSTYQACVASNNKFLSYLIHREHDLPVPLTYLVHDWTEAKLAYDALKAEGHKLVVKPLDSSHGNGVTTNITSLPKFRRALKSTYQFSRSCLVQAQASGCVDIRMLCINYRLVAALVRIPARVQGDGESTIRQLIILENQNLRRGLNYKKELNVIDVDRAKYYLGSRLEDIPATGEWVQVIDVANVGMGGETQDITEQLPDWLIAMAEKTAQVSQLLCCGVDMLAQQVPQPNDIPADLSVVITEVNKSPSLFIHEKPTHGNCRPVIKNYVDYLASLPA